MGPFYGEVGFEALYWLPWLAHLRADLQLDPARLIPITRGGSACWYQTPHAVELYGMRSLQDVRVANKLLHMRTGYSKQYQTTTFDRQIYADVAQTLGLRRYLTLHPGWMYGELQAFWRGQRGMHWLMNRVRWTPLAAPEVPPGVLPPEYVVAKFYYRGTYPKMPQTADFAEAVITQTAKHVPVILLNTGIHADDHLDATYKTLPANVYRLQDLCPMRAETTLAVQSAVIARSAGFLGTYGGLAQLAGRYHKPVLSFYLQWGGTALAHRQYSEAMALQLGIPFHALAMPDLPGLQQFLPRVVVQQGSGLLHPSAVGNLQKTLLDVEPAPI